VKRRPIPSKRKRSREESRIRRSNRDFFERKAKKYGAIEIELVEEKELFEREEER